MPVGLRLIIGVFASIVYNSMVTVIKKPIIKLKKIRNITNDYISRKKCY